jgi:toxin-antitoxin system PIN domain toxin
MEAYSNTQAWDFYQALLADDRLTCLDEPAGLEPIWRQLSSRATASPKLWMDAYLAAFAIHTKCELVTFDAGFRQFAGLSLELLTIP